MNATYMLNYAKTFLKSNFIVIIINDKIKAYAKNQKKYLASKLYLINVISFLHDYNKSYIIQYEFVIMGSQ